MIGWAVRRPAVVWATTVAILLAGGVAVTRLPLATRPQVELPRLQIEARWPRASAELVEAYLTAPVEAAVQSVRSVKKISSQSDEGSTRLTVDLEERANVQLTRLAILERLELLRSDFPPGATAPTVGNFVPEALAEQPLLRYSLSGLYTAGTLERLARERITPRLAAVAGVAGVGVSGGAEPGVAVAYDAERLRQLAVSPDAIAQAIGEASVLRSLGDERAGAAHRPVVLRDWATSLAGLADLPVSAEPGRVLRLGDLAAVYFEEDSRDFFYRVNGEPAVGLTVSRLPGADAIRTADAARRAMTQLAPEMPPGITFAILSDESADLARQLTAFLLRGAIAAATVLLVLALTLRNARVVALVLLSALVAIAGTALGLYLLKTPANLLTLAGLSMGVGVLVQNGVVVADRLRLAPDTFEGRAGAGRRITPAVLGATLTTAVVVLPFLYLQGNARTAFTPFAVAFALALGWSILSSVVMIPALGAGHGLRRFVWPRPLRLYARSVVTALRWRWVTIAMVVGLLGFIGAQFVMKVPRFSFGSWYRQRSYLYASLTFPRGSDPASLDGGMREFERVVVGRPGVEQVMAQGWRDGAFMQVTFVRGADQTPAPYLLQEEVTQRAILIGGATVGVQYQGPGYYSGGSGGTPEYRIKLLGYSYSGVERIAQDLKRRLERIPRVRNVDVNAQRFWGQEKAFGITLDPDRSALARYGLTARDLAGAVAREVSGPVGSSARLEIDGRELPVTIKAAGAEERSLDELRAALVPNTRHAPVRLGDLARVDERETLAQIDREDQQYVRTVSYEFRGPPKLGDRTHRSFLASIAVPPGYSVGDDSFFTWGEDQSGKGLWLVFTAGLVLVILVVAMVFDSVWASAEVFLSLPVAAGGLRGGVLDWWGGVHAGGGGGGDPGGGAGCEPVHPPRRRHTGASARRAPRRETPHRRGCGSRSARPGRGDRADHPDDPGEPVAASRGHEPGRAVRCHCAGHGGGYGGGHDRRLVGRAGAGGSLAAAPDPLAAEEVMVRMTGRWRTSFWIATGARVLAGCGESGGARTTARFDTLPGGAVLAHNGARGLWDSTTAWRIVEELRIGSNAGVGPTSFNQIASLAVDPGGRIYVLEAQDQQVRVFDSTGVLVRVIGRRGAGPGEFQQAMGLAWDRHGRLWVVDQGNARYTVYDTAGRLQETHSRVFSNFFSSPWLGMTGADGTIYEAYSSFGKRQVLLRLDSAFKVTDTISLPSFEGDAFKIEEQSRSVTARVPFTPGLQWRLDPRGYLWWGITAPYRIVQQRLGGDTVRVIERDYAAVRLSPGEKDSALAELKWSTDQGGTGDRSRIPDLRPAWRRILGVDGTGALWVEPETNDPHDNALDAFDSTGRYLGRLSSPFHFNSDPVFVGDRLYVETQDADGVPYVVVGRVLREGG